MQRHLAAYQARLRGRSPQEILAWVLHEFGTRSVALASSLGAEDQVLTDLLLGLDSTARIFTLDTGRLPSETYDAMQATMDHYNMHYEVFVPDSQEVADMVSGKGPNLFYWSLEERKLCCEIRKLRPLRKALASVQAWICGLRQEQSITRKDVSAIEWDETHGVYKINPLFDWTEAQVWEYARAHHVPVNALHAAGYPSIGCAPCTRAVKPGEDIRAGRWWWENPEHKECGLHERPKT
jgi:phosphoadenosine phosphosulfate reductase